MQKSVLSYKNKKSSKRSGVEFDNGARTIDIAKGDRVIFTRNEYNLDVRNGQRGMVNEMNVEKGLIEVELDNGQTKEINVQKYNHLEHGWATTTHKAQGMTVERAYMYGFANESMASQQATYVQISRAREETKLYIVAGERGVEREDKSLKMDTEQRTEALEQMKKSWSYNAAKDTTLEHISREQEMEIKQELRHNLERGQERSMGMGY